MTFEELTKANETISTMGIDKKDKKTGQIVTKQYAEVNQRIKAFRILMPNGTIETEPVSIADGVAIFRATVRDEDGRILGTGTAYEKEGSTFINQTSYIENCETSAVGRALAMCGIGIDLSIASYEEVANAKLNQEGGDMKLPLLAEEKPKTQRKVQKVEAEVVDDKKNETFKAAYPAREVMLKVLYNHYPQDSSPLKNLLSYWKVGSVDDATDEMLAVVYNKFGGK